MICTQQFCHARGVGSGKTESVTECRELSEVAELNRHADAVHCGSRSISEVAYQTPCFVAIIFSAL